MCVITDGRHAIYGECVPAGCLEGWAWGSVVVRGMLGSMWADGGRLFGRVYGVAVEVTSGVSGPCVPIFGDVKGIDAMFVNNDFSGLGQSCLIRQTMDSLERHPVALLLYGHEIDPVRILNTGQHLHFSSSFLSTFGRLEPADSLQRTHI